MSLQPEGAASSRITVEWTETARAKAAIDIDLARTVLGLGGTPDDQVGRVVQALLAWDPLRVLERVAYLAEISDPHVYQVVSLDGIPREDW